MKAIGLLFMFALWMPLVVTSQPLERRPQYNIAKEKVLYTVGYSHLDTQWNWDYPTTINVFLKNVMTENFTLFETYPDYVFNFTGSRRYEMMKEYYPYLYLKVKDYIARDRWYISGSSVDEAEMNVISPESVIRQVLYGNKFFRKEFGKESKDFMLPDCFGFPATLPSVLNHCGLLGFSTQKLTWNSAVGIPFNVGVWKGPDGKGIIAALNATGYGGKVIKRLDKDSIWNKRLEKNIKEHGLSFDYRYYGIGDQGGAPRENDVRNAISSLGHSDSDFKIVLTSSDQMYLDITPEIREKLPVYSGDLLLTEHSAGSLTSQTYMKRINRKNENLAVSAEQMAVAAWNVAGISYPTERLNNAWNLLLGNQMHDILSGTSIPKAYEYSWNDEFITANCFAGVLENSLRQLAKRLDTRVKGKSVVVYNPVAANREDVAEVKLCYDVLPENIQVFGPDGKEVPSQITARNGNILEFIFLARTPSIGLAVFDVREVQRPLSRTDLKVSSNALENEYYKVTIAPNGNIYSIFDKNLGRELLSAPARLEFLSEKPRQFPAWNMDWKDRQRTPIDYLDKDAVIRVVENGPVRVAIEVKRKGRNSEIVQIIRLSAGNAGKRVEIVNRIDWKSTGVSLKASFPLTVDNEFATYNMGVATIQRATNDKKKYEVPAHKWFDLTDRSCKFGISVLEDCKYGSDKPDNHTLRLTLLYTPEVVGDRFRYQNTQDWGVHDFTYALYSHKGDWNRSEAPWQAEYLNRPLITFETFKHEGELGNVVSFLKFNSPEIGLMTFKKAEDGDYAIVRINELCGQKQNGVSLEFLSEIEDAYEVNGQEQHIGTVNFTTRKLIFDLSPYEIRSFAIRFRKHRQDIPQQFVIIPYNIDMITFDRNRADCEHARGLSYPAELMPPVITSEGINFHMGDTDDEMMNAVVCRGQKIILPDGDYNKVYLLASAITQTSGIFKMDSRSERLKVSSWTGFIGQHYNRIFDADGEKVLEIKSSFVCRDRIAWFASHRHKGYPSANESYQYVYMYKYELNLPPGTKSLTLPDNNKIRVFAITLAKYSGDDLRFSRSFYDDFDEK